MASAKRTLNPITDTPTSKNDITKNFMLAFMKSEKATKEDIEWFKKVVKENQKEYVNRLDGSTYMDINIPEVRKAFCQKFYPNLNEKKKGKKSFTDAILDL